MNFPSDEDRSMRSHSGSEDIFLLAPSKGLGGGIERFTAGLEDAFSHLGAPVKRLDLRGPGEEFGWYVRFRLAFAICRSVYGSSSPSNRPTIIAMHYSLLLPLLLAHVRSRVRRAGKVTVLHGQEVWARRRTIRLLLRVAGSRAVAPSHFTAAAVGADVHVDVVPPALPDSLFRILESSGTKESQHDETRPLRVLSVFRFGSFEGKGGDLVIRGVERMLSRGHSVELTLCGSGSIPHQMEKLLRESDASVRIERDVTDAKLADLYSSHDVLVLATRLRAGVDSSGEGFGLVLVEAGLARCVPVSPAYGGGHEAVVPGLTGFRLRDESPEAVEELLHLLNMDRELVEEVSAHARNYFLGVYNRSQYARKVEAVFIGRTN